MFVKIGVNTKCPWPKTIDDASTLPVTVGAYGSIGKNLKLIGQGGIHPSERNKKSVANFNFPMLRLSTWPPKKPIIIGNDVWIGFDVILYEGITIGDGSIIGARSMVKHDVLPYEVVGGCPAKHLKFRFPPDIIKKLLKIKWWDWTLNKIKKNIKDFEDIDVFLAKHK